MSGASKKTKSKKVKNVRKIGSDVSKHPLSDLINFSEFETPLSKALGACGVTGNQLLLGKICLRPVILMAFQMGFDLAKLKEATQIETELKDQL